MKIATCNESKNFPRVHTVQFTRQTSPSPWTAFQHNETFGTVDTNCNEYELLPLFPNAVLESFDRGSAELDIPMNPQNPGEHPQQACNSQET